MWQIDTSLVTMPRARHARAAMLLRYKNRSVSSATVSGCHRPIAVVLQLCWPLCRESLTSSDEHRQRQHVGDISFLTARHRASSSLHTALRRLREVPGAGHSSNWQRAQHQRRPWKPSNAGSPAVVSMWVINCTSHWSHSILSFASPQSRRPTTMHLF